MEGNQAKVKADMNTWTVDYSGPAETGSVIIREMQKKRLQSQLVDLLGQRGKVEAEIRELRKILSEVEAEKKEQVVS